MKCIRKTVAAAMIGLMTSAASAIPVTYNIDSSHTYPRFSFSHYGYTTQAATFNKTTGKVVFDAAAKRGSVEIVVDMKSVNTGHNHFNEHIQSDDLLDTNKYPQATFKSTKVLFDGDKPQLIEGMLTIKGIAKPVTLTVTNFQASSHPMMKKPVLGANAFTVIKRSDFNAGKYTPHVGDELRIDIAIEAIAQPQ